MSQELRIQTDFTTPTKEQWRTLVEKDLKGVPFEKRLVTQLIEGFSVQPLYTSSDVPNPTALGLPGQAPFARGSSASRSPNTPWAILPEHRIADPAQANQAIVEDLSRGANGVVLRLSSKLLGNGNCSTSCCCGGGILVDELDGLARTLQGVSLAKTPLCLSAGPAYLSAAALLVALYQRNGVADNDVYVQFGADPLGCLASNGTLPRHADVMLAEAASLACAISKKYPNARALTVSTAAYDNAGSSAVQELAAALATAVAYLRAMENAGLSVADAGKQIRFSLAVGADQFLEIAKFRAIRVLFNRVLEAAGVGENDRKIFVHARTSRRIMTKRDPWVNVLRTTIGSFAAAVGGADQITTLPFDDVIGAPDAMARRLARNTQIILQEEGHIGSVMDAAGGSYYVDNLTLTLAEAAWKEFQAIESKGGMLAVLRDGSFAKSIEATWQKRAKDLGKRKTPITGVSEFPHLREKKVERPSVDTKALEAAILATREKRAADAKLKTLVGTVASASGTARFDAAVSALAQGATTFAVQQALGADTETVPALHLNRFASSFEKLRDASDEYLAKNGKRPRIFLANMGPIAVHTARATYAQNFFEAGGIEVISNEGFADATSAAEAFAKSGTDIAIICSSDAWYETGATEVAKALKQKKAGRVFLAGNPGQNEAAYREAGIDQFIFLGCDVLGTLTELAQYEKVVS